MDRKYRAFTLVEMLIVMGIMIILMAVGIAGARFALQRANKIQHQSAVDSMYQALQGYYSDNRKYPVVESGGLAAETAGDLFTLLTSEGYMDGGGWDGGSDATYYYFVDDGGKQTFLLCVALSPNNDEAELGYYCNGNGFDSTDLGLTSAIETKDIEAGSATATMIAGSSNGSEWTDKSF